LLAELGKYQVFGLLGLGTGKRFRNDNCKKEYDTQRYDVNSHLLGLSTPEFQTLNPSFKGQCIMGGED
jgi:hypothetical protein